MYLLAIWPISEQMVIKDVIQKCISLINAS